jgi:Domain of unknown function (DUF4149)
LKPLLRNLFRLALVLWAGSAWGLALWVAPTLFYAQSDRHLAGILVTRLFSIETYLGLGVALLATLALGHRSGFRAGYAAASLLCLNEWALKSLMSAAKVNGSALGLGFGPWHGVSAVIYMTACLLMLPLVWNEDFR